MTPAREFAALLSSWAPERPPHEVDLSGNLIVARLRAEEVRRLMNYLSQQVADPERLTEIEDALRSEYGEEFLREPDLLIYFPAQTSEILTAGASWHLRFIPHALLRSVQRGISPNAVAVDEPLSIHQKRSRAHHLRSLGIADDEPFG